MKKYPRIGVGIIVLKNNKILLGKRKSSHGDQTWQAPGGHLEFGETPEECARRELYEETGLKALNLQRGRWTNDIFSSKDKHYITIFMIVDRFKGEPMVLEPDKCECWQWFNFDNLPEPLFLPFKNLIKQYNLSNLESDSFQKNL